MNTINILDSNTIDKIAAGEVVERPASIVKELVENAMDAGSSAVTVEIKGGGIELIRVTDNGSGIDKDQIKKAFLRHATSKIVTAIDLESIRSLGFRGEALSSISAVSKTEVITKTKESLTGNRYMIEGSKEVYFDEVGAPEGTTFVVKDLFYNTPARRKFLKSASTEAGYISDLMEHLALSRPDISFKYVVNGSLKFITKGDNDLFGVIYRLYGKEIASSMTSVAKSQNGIEIVGFLGKPEIVRSNRSYEICFINNRFVKCDMVSKAIEEGYREYLMQHKFPFCVLNIMVDPGFVDVNVHPAKLDVRFSDEPLFFSTVSGLIKEKMHEKELIPEAVLTDDEDTSAMPAVKKAPEPFELNRLSSEINEDIDYKDIKNAKAFQSASQRISELLNRSKPVAGTIATNQTDARVTQSSGANGAGNAQISDASGTSGTSGTSNTQTPGASGTSDIHTSNPSNVPGANVAGTSDTNTLNTWFASTQNNTSETSVDDDIFFFEDEDDVVNNGNSNSDNVKVDASLVEAGRVDAGTDSNGRGDAWDDGNGRVDESNNGTNRNESLSDYDNTNHSGVNHDILPNKARQISGADNSKTAGESAADAKVFDRPKVIKDPKQYDFFEDKIISTDNIKKIEVIGQIFDTYIIFKYEDKVILMDQHAAHEKVNYENFMNHYRNKEIVTQGIIPPKVLALTGAEKAVLSQYIEVFRNLGFDIEEFGGNEFVLRGVPVDLYGLSEEQLFLSVLDELTEMGNRGSLRAIEEKIASMSCKAAIKGNQKIGTAEMEGLIRQLMDLENPYNCPHGRPTMVIVTREELDKRFKRIV
ncbi:MAG: DNA mismatch repair endonuclease MutL [Lachnospiraceae bacterium]|nr:DNA mismatch repair endonuclease MutL [Lachnospiraceae bacterium]